MNKDDVNIMVRASSSNNQDGSHHLSHNQDGSHHQSHNQDGSNHQDDMLAHVSFF